ncbi:MAG TPA: hypothetical protein VF981_10335, partial [Gemmatimonadaceae bacterium]
MLPARLRDALRNRVTVGLAVLLVPGIAAGAQFPRMAPPPPCRAAAPDVEPLLSLWGRERAPDVRPRVAVFALQSEIDDPARLHYGLSLAQRLRERLASSPRLRVASEGSVVRALSLAQGRSDSAGTLLRADYELAGRVRVSGSTQDISVTLVRTGETEPVWQAAFRATSSLRAIEDVVVRGLWRALSLPGAPVPPLGWPTDAAAYEAIIAGDVYLRSPTRAGADSAAVAYLRARELAPGSSVAASRLARAYLAARERGGEERVGAAGLLALISEALQTDSLLSEAWTVRAMIARVQDPVRFEGAVEAHRRAVTLAPADADAEHEYGVTLMRLGDTRGARQHFHRALDLEPSRSATIAALAEMERRAEGWAAACVLTNASIIAWPFDPLAYAVRAQARMRLADARDAYSDAEMVQRLTAGAWPDALRVVISSGAGNVDAARRLALEMTAAWLAPSPPLTVRDAEYMALAYLSTGDARRAVESLRRAQPVGTDLGVVLRAPGLEAIRSDTAIVRLL